MRLSHLIVLLIAFYGGLIIAGKMPSVVNTATLGLVKAA